MRRLLWLACSILFLAHAGLATPEALLKDGAALAPLRAVVEWLGAEIVAFDQSTASIRIVVRGKTVELTVGKATARVDRREMALPTAPILREGVTYVPLRFVSEAFGATVDWDAKTSTVTVMNPATGERLTIPARELDAPPPPAVAAAGATVFVTASGEKYHVEGCTSLASSKTPLTLAEAVGKGYTPCLRCRAPTLEASATPPPVPTVTPPPTTPPTPPTADDPTVYITKSGRKYHAETCPSLSSSKTAVKHSEAKAKGLEACARCKPDGQQ